MKKTKSDPGFCYGAAIVVSLGIALAALFALIIDRFAYPLFPGPRHFRYVQADFISVGKPGGPQIMMNAMAGGANVWVCDAKGEGKISLGISPTGHPLVEIKAGGKGYIRIDAMNKSDRPSITLGDPISGAPRWKVTLDEQGSPMVTENTLGTNSVSLP